jgi:hypothetical protein
MLNGKRGTGGMTREVPVHSICEVIILTALPVECRAILSHLQEQREVVHPSGTIYYQGSFAGEHHS